MATCPVCNAELSCKACAPPSKIGAEAMPCPLKKGALWIEVADENGTGVEGVSVTANGETKTTDSTGFAFWDPLPSKAYEAKLEPLAGEIKTKYLPADVMVNPVTVTDGQIARTKFVIYRKAKLRVKVSDNDDPKRQIADIKILVTKAEAPVGEMPSEREKEVALGDLKPGAYKVKIELTAEEKTKFRVETPGDSQNITLAGADDKLVEFKVTPIIRIHLKLQFNDPSKNAKVKERVMPKGLEVQLYFKDDSKVEAIVGDEGLVLDSPGGKKYIEAPRSKEWFTLKFKQKKPAWVVCEKWDADDIEKNDLLVDDDPGTEAKKKAWEGKRVFLLPNESSNEWTMKNSDWTVSQAPTYTSLEARFESLTMLSTKVGDEAQPALLTLDPHWQYLRFEYFDRLYGLDDHDKKPISSLPLPVAGYADEVRSDEKPAWAKLTTYSSWVFSTEDKKDQKLLQAVPWIIRADDKNKELHRPAQVSMLRIETDEDHRYIKSTAKDKREYKKLAKSDADWKPGAKRLAYYDLPEEWRSSQYFCRLSDKADDQDFFEGLVDRATSEDKPLIFSFDDIQLTDKTGKPIDWNYKKTEDESNPNDRVAVFLNTFDGDDWSAAEPAPPTEPTPPSIPDAPPAPPPPTVSSKPAGRTKADALKKRDELTLPDKPQGPSTERWHSPQGVYRHDRKNNMPYFSRIDMKSNYLADTARWVRLVAAKGNLYDVFDQRVKFDSSRAKKTVGARAAICWEDLTASGVGVAAGSAPPNAALVKDGDKHPYFSVQPYFTNRFFARDMPRPGSNRYDEWTSAIAEDDGTDKCGRWDLALIRCCKADGETEITTVLQFHKYTFDFVSDGGSTVAGDPAKQKKWRSDYMADCASRWSGNDTYNSDRAWLTPLGTVKSKAQVVNFLQSFEVGAASLAASKCHFNIKVVAEVGAGGSWMNNNGLGQCRGVAGGHVTGRGFPGAHESGHGYGMPDEYPSNEEAFGLQGWGSNNVPGAPFNLDQPAAKAMMVYNNAIRPRYFWTLTEWLRNNFADLKDSYKVVHGAEDDYRLPHHPTGSAHPGRSFAFWPIAAYTRYSTPSTVIYDAYLMKLGKEIFSTSVLPGAPVDGILTILVNLSLRFGGTAADPSNGARRNDFAQKIYQTLDNALNQKVFAAFNIDTPAVAGDPRKFVKCYLNFTFRFSSEWTTGSHMLVYLQDGITSQAGWNSGDKTIECDLDGATWEDALNAARDYAVKEILAGLGLSDDSTAASYFGNADAYIPIVQSVAPGITPTMTRT